MAMQTINPYPVASDMTELKEIKDQLMCTGHPVSLATIKSWIRDQDLYTERYRGGTYVSYSDILMAHREAVTGEF
ncbi:hypothetical protein [Streptomyces sp. NPDC059783]|uniref:hypothetical protein n=1 Tax=Streptomyces sp. NPDC059783 TaxID=3346944 RepID=UPI00364C72AA